MIIEVEQTSSNFKNDYQISFNNIIKYYAKASWITSVFNCSLIDINDHCILKAVYDFKLNFKNLIPFKWLSGTPKLSEYCNIINDKEENQGNFMRSTTRFFQSKYVIKQKNSILNGYSQAKGAYKFVSIYDDKEEQVGLIIKPLNVECNLDTYKLYLLNEVNIEPEFMALFMVYYDNWNYGRHGQIVFYNMEISREFTISNYKDKLDLDWLDENFPNHCIYK